MAVAAGARGLRLVALALALLGALELRPGAVLVRWLPSEAATTEAFAASAVAELVDPRLWPLLWRGTAAGSQSSAHEREADFSSWLYAEGD